MKHSRLQQLAGKPLVLVTTSYMGTFHLEIGQSCPVCDKSSL